MKVKYTSSENNIVSDMFVKFISKNYTIPLMLNILMAFLLLIIILNGVCRSIFLGDFNLRLYEVLLMPIMVIPIVNSLQAITIISMSINKISNGNYFVNRHKYMKEEKGKIFLSNNEAYPLCMFYDKSICQLGSDIDIVSITNNYGTAILMFAIPLLVEGKYTNKGYVKNN